MTFPSVSALTAGIVLVLQMVFTEMTKVLRATASSRPGHELQGHATESTALFLVSFALLEISGFDSQWLAVICAAFVMLRFFHGIGALNEHLADRMRLVGRTGTYCLGIILGCLLILTGYTTLTVSTLPPY